MVGGDGIAGGETMMNEDRCSSRGTLWIVGLLVLSCACSSSPSENDARASVVRALDGFAQELEEEPPTDAGGLYPRIRSYLEAHPDFYGSAVALLNAEAIVTASPYVYRTGDGFAELDLATPDYHIDEQEWLATPRDSKKAIWTDPYFDAGGGKIWMVTRSVPLIRDGTVVLVVTTDLPVDAPAD
jgi:sigma-B regulation protein RsbU (phosphoserine phosphatase)